MKNYYKIPESLTKNYLDMEIAIKTKDGIGLRPLKIKTLFCWMLVIMGLFILLNKSSLVSASGNYKFFFSVFYLLFFYNMLKTDKTGRMGIRYLLTVITYIPKNYRKVFTRKTNNVNNFYNIVGIDRVDENGYTVFSDNTCGFFYRVVGSASALLFNEDRANIIDRVDSFYRRLTCDAEYGIITIKEPQKIDNQLKAIDERYKKLTIINKDINSLLIEQKKVLENKVGHQ